MNQTQLMKKKYSYFKNPKATQSIVDWVAKLETANGYKYTDIVLETSLGKTQVWAYNLDDSGKETLVIFPGTRTSALFWDLD